MTIPIRPPLETIQLYINTPSRDHRFLNLKLYQQCRREGLPLPRFEKQGSRSQRYVSLADQESIRSRVLEPGVCPGEFLTALCQEFNLDALIVHDIRRGLA